MSYKITRASTNLLFESGWREVIEHDFRRSGKSVPEYIKSRTEDFQIRRQTLMNWWGMVEGEPTIPNAVDYSFACLVMGVKLDIDENGYLNFIFSDSTISNQNKSKTTIQTVEKRGRKL